MRLQPFDATHWQYPENPLSFDEDLQARKINWNCRQLSARNRPLGSCCLPVFVELDALIRKCYLDSRMA